MRLLTKKIKSMIRLIILTIFLLMANFSFSQIEVMKHNKPAIKEPIIPYDSLESIDKYNKKRHIGQTLYLMPTKKNERNGVELYTSFKTWDMYGNYESLKGKYFKLIDVIEGSEIEDVYMQLIESETQDTVYCNSYLDTDVKMFLTVGYFEKLKSQIVGKRFVYRKNEIRANPMRNIEDRTPVRNIPDGTVFEATSIAIDELFDEYDMYNYVSQLSLLIVILNNDEYGQFFVSQKEISKSFNPHEYFRLFMTEAEYLSKLKEDKVHRDFILKKFGATKGKLILQSKVRLGFTSEMCRYSWGNPSDINKTTGSYGVHEQWVYEDSYLYFENGILTTIQN